MGLSLDQWPFTYFKAFCVTPPGVSENADTGVAAVFGFFFHDGVRQGALLLHPGSSGGLQLRHFGPVQPEVGEVLPQPVCVVADLLLRR